METSVLESTLKKFINVIAPERCVGCFKEGSWLCIRCRHDIPKRHTLRCVACEQEHRLGFTCKTCKKQSPLTGVLVLGSYTDGTLRRAVQWIKFKGIKDLASPLGQLLLPKLQMITSFDKLKASAYLVPIPLHKRRFRERGFNQSALIAEEISKYSGIRVLNCLNRVRKTRTQAQLPTEFRSNNLEGVFKVTCPLSTENTYILVDDVMTTGSTLISAAKELKKSGAENIWGLAIASG